MSYYLFNRPLDSFSDEELTQFYQGLKKKLDVMEKEVEKRKEAPHFAAATDPYRKAGGRNYWKLHVPAEQRPDWVKEEYGLD